MPIEKPNFFGVEIAKIIVSDRKRKTHGDVEGLADSIAKFGLFHPIILTRRFELVAGERRLLAFQHLHRTEIPAQFVDELNEFELREIELEENTRRLNMTWQEEAQAVYDYHQHRLSADPDWTMSCTADCLGLSEAQVKIRVTVFREAVKTPELIKTDNLSTAYNTLLRRQSRAMDNELEALLAVEGPAEEHEIETPLVITPAGIRPRPAPDTTILNINFSLFVDETDKKFNLLHCDFPYGSDFHESGQVAGTWEDGLYIDTKMVFEGLVYTMLTYMDQYLAQSAHILFWYQASRYQEMIEIFSPHFKINPVPLIWFKSDSTGILSDPKRGPRHVYETALLMSRGDRNIVSPVNNVIAFPANRAKAEHPSEKPYPVVHHFLRMLVDEHTIFLDPTCGSGTAVAAAEKLGAQHVQGIENNKQHAETARRVLNRYRTGS